ncbi:uncharacterized protein LY89DRAFT_686803 [Mollisia scopiformis]|uniref:Uncharacterized protein n=1 Tax=Mollisia scopiformis TaxID=149040 RepID=A0A194X3B5_MOLSC|nr:uncharacterized protein LY89DRAFT_686803 [Mollisia scopiformis]KUJ14317.1 hypothetical protein LY89DRAFT_686803 [Mollisia scopiformis]
MDSKFEHPEPDPSADGKVRATSKRPMPPLHLPRIQSEKYNNNAEEESRLLNLRGC